MQKLETSRTQCVLTVRKAYLMLFETSWKLKLGQRCSDETTILSSKGVTRVNITC
jgi:hypothetical protein